MSTRGRSGNHRQPAYTAESSFRMAPIARAVALVLAAGGVMNGAQAQTAFSSGWFAAKGAVQNAAGSTGKLPNGMPLVPTASQRDQQQQANAQLQRSINNLNVAARGIAAQQAAQAAARQAALLAGGVPDGLADGGLKVDGNALTAGWQKAGAPVQSQVNGRINVAIEQTADRAILNWETFNVGRNTTVDFKQQSNWAVLNRVNDPRARPSQIQGQIKGDGTVMVVNRNGVVFSGSSQVSTRNLIAAATDITDDQFKSNGIFSPASLAAFTNAQGKIEVQAGARIASAEPNTSTQGGGYVLLLGNAVSNAGDIATPKGQTVLAAGDSFVIKKGVGTDGNLTSTTRGSEVTPQFNAAGDAGQVLNTGLIQAREGDVTLTGRDIRQQGVALATTTVNTRGTLHVNAVGSAGSIVLAPGAVTAVVIEADGKTTALDGQRDALRAPVSLGGENVVNVHDFRDQSRLELISGGTVDFQGDTLTLATGGQIVVAAGQRTLVRDGALIDVSGAVGVTLAMESNNVQINVQGNEQRDAPVNRDGKTLNSKDVWIDRRTLVLVPKGTNGYDSDRWYTAGGLLEVSGYLGTQGHTVGEWMAQGGTISFTGKEVVTQKGSNINLSGGTLDVQSGYLNQTWLRGADGRLYEASRAPGDLRYTGIYQGYEDKHERWGDSATTYYYSPLLAPKRRFEEGYTVGRDAGQLVIATGSAVLEGDIATVAFQGTRQTRAEPAGDGYKLPHDAVARRGQLIVGSYTPMFNRTTGALDYSLTALQKKVELTDSPERIASDLDLAAALPAGRDGKLVLDTGLLNDFSLGAIRIAALDEINVQGALQVAAGGIITLYGSDVRVDAGLTARGGNIVLGNVLNQMLENGLTDTPANPNAAKGAVTLTRNAALDASGLWSNLLQDPADTRNLPYLNGGRVTIRASHDVTLEQGSVIDVSSGATMQANGKLRGGKGGDVTLRAVSLVREGRLPAEGSLTLAGELSAAGVSGGGKLTLQTTRIQVGGGLPSEPGSSALLLDAGFFNIGFSSYDLTANQQLLVADGAVVDVTMPVLQAIDGARTIAGGAKTSQALERVLPEQYQPSPKTGVMGQRRGASLNMQAGTLGLLADSLDDTLLNVGKGAVVSVDPGQTIALGSAGQLSVDGRLNAWGGNIVLSQIRLDGTTEERSRTPGHNRSIRVGQQAVLDASARAVTAVDVRGWRYGVVGDGGRIVVGGELDAATGLTNGADQFVLIERGARLEASGAQAVLDLSGSPALAVAGDGGHISVATRSGLYLEGDLIAHAGGAGAAGGTLNIGLDSDKYPTSMTVPDRVRAQREMIITRERLAEGAPGSLSAVAGGDLAYGNARVSADMIQNGGFDAVSLLASTLTFSENVVLAAGRSVSLYAGTIGLTNSANAATQVTVAAPYVRLAEHKRPVADFYVGAFAPVIAGSARESQGVFTVQANLIDLRDAVSVGGSKAVNAPADVQGVDRRGFERVALHSTGDIRFLAANLVEGVSVLATKNQLDVEAAQIYPAVNANGMLRAGRIDVARVGQADPAMPHSAFGRLTLEADVINQGGVLRAPLGTLVLGNSNTSGGQLNLLPGSLTSVSGAGLVMPYGGTVDGVAYAYGGKSIEPLFINGALGTLTLQSESLQVSAGAVVDISGGGELTGAGFVSGRGGSTDARYHALVQMGADGGFTLPGLASNPVYAIVPGVQAPQAPVGDAAVEPAVGRQITLATGVAGLPAGTYTLMPSSYALLPGAYRVEINGGVVGDPRVGAMAMRNGSTSASARLSIAGTGVRDTHASQVILTPADVLRTYSQYNEMGLAAFALADAARLGVPAVLLPRDGKRLHINLNAPVFGKAPLERQFSFDGVVKSDGVQGGERGTSRVYKGDSIEIIADGAMRTPGFAGATLRDADLNAIAAGGLSIGGAASVLYGQGGNILAFRENASRDIYMRSGATLVAPAVFLVAAGSVSGITVEQGASIITLGQGAATQDSARGYVFSPGSRGVLAVSNGRVDMLANDPFNPTLINEAPASIRIGVCEAVCAGSTRLYSEGAIAMATYRGFELTDAVRYGTRHLALAVGGINAGSAENLASLDAQGKLPAGLTLNQNLLDRLLRGDTDLGAPALETLSLAARDGMRFYGDVVLDTYDANGQSRLQDLVLTTPALYGAGSAANTVTLRTASLIWNGSEEAPGAVITGGAGDGDGVLNIDAGRITLGYAKRAQVKPLVSHERVALGFSTVNLNASERITANHEGGLAVHHKQGAYVAGKGYDYTGGDLNLVSPLLTGQAASVTRMSAGGTLRATSGSGAAAQTPAGLDASAMGGELSLAGRDVIVDTTVVLPSGKLTLKAERDLTLTGASRLDLAGRAIVFNDVTRYSWGGDVKLASLHGSIVQAAGGVIDVSAQHNQGGSIEAVALDAAAGVVALQGAILGSASGHYDAGGTWVPYRAGSVDIRAQNLGGALTAEFAALNQRLNDGQVFGGRSFQLKQGSLVIGSEVKASEVNVSVDSGSLTVAGVIDASGERVGAIRLAAKQGLTLTGNALLDAHGSALRVDSYGKIIESPNRAIVELRSGDGVLTLASGARIDLRHGTAAVPGNAAGQHDGRRLGTLALYAPRIDAQGRPTDLAADNDPSLTPSAATYGDIAVDARGGLDIQGARSIAVYAVQRDDKAPDSVDVAVNGRPYQVIDQAYLDRRHAESTVFMNAALGNGTLMHGKLAGLNNAAYRDAFHLRPGLELISKTADGDLVVQGDLDLSGYRYASVNPTVRSYVAGALPGSPGYGAGESGGLSIRAGGDLNVYGSITDGFAPPPATQDDGGWLLVEGVQPFGGDVLVPGGNVTLHEGTAFERGKVLNFDLPIQAMTMQVGTVLPAVATLNGATTFAAGTALSGDILNADGSVAHAAGSILAQDTPLTAGMKLGAGSRLASDTAIAAMTWPAGVPLPSAPRPPQLAVTTVKLAGTLALKAGSIIPSMTDVKLGGAESIALRPADADGNHGRNWALAQMLPAGSQSWSLQLVAGADLGAADPRLTNPNAAHGSLRLADTHYGMNATPAGKLVWTVAGATDMGAPELAGQPIDFESGPAAGWPSMCSEYPEFCEVQSSYVWTEKGAIDMGAPELVGLPIDFNNGPAGGWPTMCSEYPEFCQVASADYDLARGGSRTSVLRTGTGDLELAAAGDLRMDSLYGVYTAGTATTVDSSYNQPRGRGVDGKVLLDRAGMYESMTDGGADSIYQAWYPDHGGNVILSAGGKLIGDVLAQYNSGVSTNDLTQASSSALGNWLWRQGSGQALSDQHGLPAAWWINFGTYATVGSGSNASTNQVGFTGFGALGGGNVDVRVGQDAGAIEHRGDTTTTSAQQRYPRSQSLVLAIGSTGRVGADGALHLTGGGDLSLRVGGGINPTLAARNMLDFDGRISLPVHDLQGAIVNLRGATQVQAGALGGIDLQFSRESALNDSRETRSFDVYTATMGSATGGPILVPGDSAMMLNTRGDLVVGAAADAGRTPQRNSQSFTLNNGTPYLGGGSSWFSLWTPHTAIDLFSAGGNITPSTQSAETNNAQPNSILEGRDASPTDGRFVYPSILRVVAAQGSIYYGGSALSRSSGSLMSLSQYGIVLAPSARSELAFLAGQSLYGSGYPVSMSSASASALATPMQPGFVGRPDGDTAVISNQGAARLPVSGERYPLFAYADDTAAGNSSGQGARFYAAAGDIVGLRVGEQMTFRDGQNAYIGAGPVRIMAGRDIVGSGTPLGQPASLASELSGISIGNLFVHNLLTDVSLVSAGRDILYSSFNVAGPGVLEINAGRDIRMDDRASVASLGAVAVNDTRPGADIVMVAGAGAAGPDYQGLLQRYLDSANLLPAGSALADRPGSAVKLYSGKLTLAQWLREQHGYAGDEDGAQAFLDQLQARRDADRSKPRRVLAADYEQASQLNLVNWMQTRHGYTGADEDALAAFQALAPEQRGIFARQIYYAELRAGGREYNEAGGVRFGSYLRGREAISALFPQTTADGQPRVYLGGITLYGSAGVNTLFGGNIQMLTPGGAQVFGTEGEAPVVQGNVTPGIVTQGAGDIQLYSRGSILLGQSRIMTTFGGSVLGWSAEGDINAGRGSKSTIVYTPPKRVYDQWGNVTVSSNAPSTGAGIATLAPIPEVPAGDIDLIAPLGTIDAGEAGIRFSGNANIAALRVVNAENIKGQGESTGIPAMATVNVSALSNASATASSAAAAAQDTAQRSRAEARQNQASIFTVQVLGFGAEPLQGGGPSPATPVPGAPAPDKTVRYDAANPVQLVGNGQNFDAQGMANLTEAERRALKQN